MELVGEALGLEPGIEGIHAIGDDQGGTLVAFGEEIAEGTVEGPCHADGLATLGDQGEGPVEIADGGGIRGPEAFTGFVRGGADQTVEVRIEEIDDAFDVGIVGHGSSGFIMKWRREGSRGMGVGEIGMS
jgi:hypothetical protein